MSQRGYTRQGFEDQWRFPVVVSTPMHRMPGQDGAPVVVHLLIAGPGVFTPDEARILAAQLVAAANAAEVARGLS